MSNSGSGVAYECVHTSWFASEGKMLNCPASCFINSLLASARAAASVLQLCVTRAKFVFSCPACFPAGGLYAPCNTSHQDLQHFSAGHCHVWSVLCGGFRVEK